LSDITLGADDFRVWMPLAKSGAPDGERLLRGVASAETPDFVHDEILHKGMDFAPCMERGYLNFDHKEDAGSIIGVPRHMEIVRAEEHPLIKSVNPGLSGPCLWVEGVLWGPEYNHRGADEAWALAKASEAAGRPLGWSVQGKIRARNGRRIVKSEVRHLALTHQPLHRSTFAELAKSFSGDLDKSETTQSVAPLRLENLWPLTTSVLWGDGSCGHFDKNGQYTRGVRGAMEHLHKCAGMSPGDAGKFIDTLRKSRIFQVA
jgi:hypothetical protein